MTSKATTQSATAPTQELPQVMTSEEIADLLSVCKETARRLMLTGKIPATRVGKRWYASRAEVYKFLRLEG